MTDVQAVYLGVTLGCLAFSAYMLWLGSKL